MTATAQSQSPQTFEVITPDRQLADNVTYRQSKPGEPGPVEIAEQQLKLMSNEFDQWLKDDFKELRTAWQTLKHSPDAADVFLRFHRAIHNISGNAAMLDCPAASQLAKPIARLIERTPTIDDHQQLIDSAMHAIANAIASPVHTSLDEVHEGLETIVSRWIDKQYDTRSGRR